MTLAFVPIAAADLEKWATAGVSGGSREAFAVTPALVEAFGFAGLEDEAAEHEILCEASAAALVAYGRRLVVVARVAVELTPDIFGRVRVSDVPYDAVMSIFRDDSGSEQVAEIARRVGGLTLEQALDRADVQRMLSTVELLWYGPTEWPEAIGD